MTSEDFQHIVTEVRQDYFPELAYLSIGIRTFTSDAYFLQIKPEIKSLFKNKEKRAYYVELNSKLLDCPPSELALKSILVHEFEHVKDFAQWSSSKLAAHGIEYSLSCGKRVAYERATDRKVLEKNLHEGLALYREWVYQWLTPAELAKKKKIYLTPEENSR